MLEVAKRVNIPINSCISYCVDRTVTEERKDINKQRISVLTSDMAEKRIISDVAGIILVTKKS